MKGQIGWIGVGALTLGALTACSHVSSRKPASSGGFCVSEHSGKDVNKASVTVCDELYPSSPMIRPPADSVHGPSAEIFAALWMDNMNQPRFVDREGTVYEIQDSKGEAIQDFASLNKAAASFKMPNDNYLYEIYKVAGEIVKGSVGKAIRVSSVAPAATISGCAIDSAFLGTWKGTVSARESDTMFDADHPVAIEIEFKSLKPTRNLTNWKGNKLLADGKVYALEGEIQDMASIRSNPFKGASGSSIELFRITAMHMAGDNHVAVGYPQGAEGFSPTGMGGISLMSAAALIQEHPTGDFASVRLQPHSSAAHVINQMLILELHPTSIGSAKPSCQ